MRTLNCTAVVSMVVGMLATLVCGQTTEPAAPLVLARALATMPSDLRVSGNDTALRRTHREAWVSDQIKGKVVIAANAKVVEVTRDTMTVEMSPQVLIAMSENVVTERKLKKGDTVTITGTVRAITSKVTATDTRLVVMVFNVTVK